MTTHVRGLVAVIAIAALLTACSAAPEAPKPAEPAPTPPPSAEASAAYERYWSVVDASFAEPGSRDWSSQLKDVATGPALASVSLDVENYADLPAHRTGVVKRSPEPAQVAGNAASVLDCVDISEARLVADDTGQILDDTANKVSRYRFRAELVHADGRWLVERTSPLLDQPC